MIHCAVDVVHVASRQRVDARCHPGFDFGQIGLGEGPVSVRLDLAILDVDNRDLVHLDPALAVFGINAENGGAVFADAEEIGGKALRHGHLFEFRPEVTKTWPEPPEGDQPIAAQNRASRSIASARASLDVA